MCIVVLHYVLSRISALRLIPESALCIYIAVILILVSFTMLLMFLTW